MRFYKILAAPFLVLITVSSGISQEKKVHINKETGRLEVSAEVLEEARQRIERLKDPTFIKLELVPVSDCQDEDAQKTSNCYNAQSNIKLKLLMTNTSSKSITFSIGQPYYPYNIELFKDGQSVPYRKGVSEMVGKLPASDSPIGVKLEPGKTELADMIYLSTWYMPLEPGHYQIEIKRRFLPDGGWTDAASTTFEVEPK